MLDATLNIALAHLAVALIPGHSLALVTSGIAAAGTVGGVRVVAGVTIAKLVWTSAALGVLPLVLAAGPELLLGLRIGGGLALVAIGLPRVVRAVRRSAPRHGLSGTVRGGFAACLFSPTTGVFFLAAFPVLAAPLPVAQPRETAILLLAIAATSLMALLPWLGLGLAARRFGADRLHSASGAFMCMAGAALAVSAF